MKTTKILAKELNFPLNFLSEVCAFARQKPEKSEWAYNKLTEWAKNESLECDFLCLLCAVTDIPKYYKIVVYRYREGMTLQKIANIFGVTRERVRQILQNMIGKLYICKDADFIFTNGYRKYLLKEKTKSYEEGVSKGISIGYQQGLEEKSKREDKFTLYKAITLEEMNLSVRAYNSLCRYGVRNLKDLLELPLNELLRVRNFGRVSLKEIIETFERYGIDTEQYKKAYLKLCGE